MNMDFIILLMEVKLKIKIIGFWDADGYYFNKEGKDKHGGYYNDDWEYVPGKDWDPVNQCYPGEENDFDDEDAQGKLIISKD